LYSKIIHSEYSINRIVFQLAVFRVEVKINRTQHFMAVESRSMSLRLYLYDLCNIVT
jgi:hypothetical protein